MGVCIELLRSRSGRGRKVENLLPRGEAETPRETAESRRGEEGVIASTGLLLGIDDISSGANGAGESTKESVMKVSNNRDATIFSSPR